MKNFHEQYSNLQQEMNKESVVIYNTLAKKFGSEPLFMGNDPITKKPRVLINREVVKVKLETVLDNCFTKVNHIGIQKDMKSVFVKGWVVYQKRYRLMPFEKLTAIEKINVLQYMNNLI